MEELQNHTKEEFPDVIVLNVGGIVYTTTKSTLLGEKCSMLAALFSGRYKVPRDPEGRFFIDRDGSNFAYILAYLRGDRSLPPAQAALKVLDDAEYFQIHGLVDTLQMYPNVFREKLINLRNERFRTECWKQQVVRIGQEMSLQSLSSTSRLLIISEEDFNVLIEEPSCVGNQHSILVTKNLKFGPKYSQETFECLSDRLRNPNIVIKDIEKKDMDSFIASLQKQLTDDGYDYKLMEETACCKTVQKAYGFAKDICDFVLKYYFLEFTWFS